MLKGFKAFILRGNVVDLAVGVVIGAAFGSVITALVKDVITPLIGAIGKVEYFSNLSFSINGSQILYGDFINAIISFLLVAVAIYFAIVLPMNTLNSRLSNKKENTPSTKKCPECLSDVPVGARRCAHCTAQIN